MRLIDADRLRKDVIDLPNCYNGFSDTYDKAMIVDIVDAQPTVDAEPTEEQVKEYCRKRCLVVLDSGLVNEMKARWSETVKHGHWNPWRCSKCGGRAPIHWDGEIRSYAEWRAPYCPSCGAKMDGEASA